MTTIEESGAGRVERWIEPLGGARVETAGSKAGHLGALREAGFPVPDGFVVKSAAFGRFVAQAALPVLPATDAQEAALAAPVPADIARAIREAYRALGGGRVAVRSSGLAEDLADATFAGQYETVLDVEGEDEVVLAVRRAWASVFAPRVAAYLGARHAAGGAMAVLVQRMVAARAAGVAFGADPITGARDVVSISAVPGLGEALVSGTTDADEWVVEAAGPRQKRSGHDVLVAAQAGAVAALTRPVMDHFGGAPQDIEWAIDARGELALLQARPMTALPEPVVWQSPLPGAWIRNFRLGEWLGDPLTPLFDSWLLERLEAAFMRRILSWFPMPGVPATVHVTVNGWYFYGLAFPETLRDRLSMAWGLVRSLWKDFRFVAGFLPPLAHLGFERHLALWRGEVLPAYERAVRDAEARVDEATPAQASALVDELADHAGATLFSIVALGGLSAKLEGQLIALWRKHVDASDVGVVLALVRSASDPETPAHAVSSLDWYFPTAGERAATGEETHAAVPAAARERIARERGAVEAKLDAAVARRPALRRKLDALIAFARRAHEVREEQARALTLAWPVLRRALDRVAGALVARGALADVASVHFLTREEVAAALAGGGPSLDRAAAQRRVTWERQRRLTPPLLLGELTGMWKQTFAMIDGLLASEAPAGAIKGMPGSPGRVTARVRVVRSIEEIGRLRDGEVLVTPVTTPAWTPAFARAAAVVTDSGSLASHASIVAREYGIPAVVATGNATALLADGETVTVDGSAGLVAR